jgi:hypothetical protein
MLVPPPCHIRAKLPAETASEVLALSSPTYFSSLPSRCAAWTRAVGTDCLFYGSPQDQIQALRSFHISEEFQERFDGYPQLTRRIKDKIMGVNGARLYGVETDHRSVRVQQT